MKVRLFFVSLFLIAASQVNMNAQSFGSGWKCDYATWDEQPNSAGYNVVSVGTIKENCFVALVLRSSSSTSYLVGYADADSSKGRLGTYAYGSALAGYQTKWSQGFDEVPMLNAYDVAATSDSLIYVANNDIDKNILVFKMTKDTIATTDYRMMSGATSDIWAIDVDANGRVYVTQAGDSTTPGKILVFKSIKEDDNWGNFHDTKPLYTITAPEAGDLRGVTVNAAGTLLYVSNYYNKKVYCYVGSPSTGYTLYNGFNFTLTDTKVSSGGNTLVPGPWGVKYLNSKNILFVAASLSFTTSGYEYGKVFALNPNTGAIVDTLDVAQWNYLMTGSYSSRTGGTVGNVSGYTSVYNVDFDANFNMYTQSFYGWTVDKWTYNGTLPVIPVTITGIQKIDKVQPFKFNLEQNYPNPFNPVTNIEFSLNEDSEISILIYSITGELVTEIVKNTSFAKGTYKVSFDASKLASGAYIYTLKTRNSLMSKKMILMK